MKADDKLRNLLNHLDKNYNLKRVYYSWRGWHKVPKEVLCYSGIGVYKLV